MGALSLHGMLDIAERMKPYVNDYKMMLVEAREHKLTLHNMNNVYFFNMLEVVLDKSLSRNEARQKVIDYAKEHSVDTLVIMALAGATNCKIDYSAFDRKGNVDMCTLFEEIARENEAKDEVKGEAKGIVETGFEFGVSENDILKRL